MSDLIDRRAATSIPILPKEHRKIFKSIDDAFETGWNEALSCVNMLPSAQSEQRWIPFRERSPKEGQQILACSEDGVMWMTAYNSQSRFSGAWMPLPEPYKGGEIE